MCIKADNGDFRAICKCFKLNAEALCKNAADVLFNLRNFNRNIRCIAVCPKDAITPDYDQAVEVFNYKIAEYAKAVVDGRPSFHISIARDISPDCDCHEENDVPMVPDVGMFASFDPVALDLACIEAVNRQPILPGSALAERGDPHDHDHLHATHPDTCWQAAIEHGKKIGLGTDEYTLITVK